MSRWQYVITFPRVAKSYVHIPSPLLRVHTRMYTRANVRTQRRPCKSNARAREREREHARCITLIFVTNGYRAMSLSYTLLNRETLNRGIMLSPGSFFRCLFFALSPSPSPPFSLSLARTTRSLGTHAHAHTDKTNAPVSRARDECVISPRTNDCPYVFSGTKRTPRLEA